MDFQARSFRLNPVARLHWVGWDNEYVVFEETSGQTHQLDALRAFVLNAAVGGTLRVADVVADLMEALPSQSSEESTALLASVLQELETVGLLESAAE